MNRPLSESQKIQLGDLKHRVKEKRDHFESIWHQKSRVKWTLLGDKNTTFFHRVASAHFRSNRIFKVNCGDHTVSEPVQIKEAIF